MGYEVCVKSERPRRFFAVSFIAMNLKQLNDTFAIPAVLKFEESEQGLISADINTSECQARIYLQGAHLTHWQPRAFKPVIFLSERSAFVPGKAIRGGVPIIFPWFGARTATPESPRTDGPSHGFARTSQWQLESAGFISNDNFQIVLKLEANETSRALGFDKFEVVYQITLGAELDLQITVKNKNNMPLRFEEALHTYLHVGDVKKISIDGLAGCEYLDKTDGFKKKTQSEPSLQLRGETDRPYINTESAVSLRDPELSRRISVDKVGSKSTVIWNPWQELTATMSDMSPQEWLKMTCIETANVGVDGVTIGPGEEHTMRAHYIAVSV